MEAPPTAERLLVVRPKSVGRPSSVRTSDVIRASLAARPRLSYPCGGTSRRTTMPSRSGAGAG